MKFVAPKVIAHPREPRKGLPCLSKTSQNLTTWVQRQVIACVWCSLGDPRVGYSTEPSLPY